MNGPTNDFDGRRSPVTARRHTLGSDHDSPRSTGPEVSDLPPVPLSTNDRPRPVWWRAVGDSARLAEQEPSDRILEKLFGHVDGGWEHMALLVAVAEKLSPHRRRSTRDPRTALLMDFVELELAEGFHRCARLAAVVISGPNTIVPSIQAVEEAAETFGRRWAVFQLAAADPALPKVLVDAVRAGGTVWADWPVEFVVLASAAIADR